MSEQIPVNTKEGMMMHITRFAPALLGAALLLSGTAHAQAATATKTTRTYDCTKAGNANKAACKTAAAKPAPAAKAAPAAAPAAVAKTTTTRNYDCSKAGNANKAACKTSAKPTVFAAPAPAAAPVVAPAAPAARTTAVRTQQASKMTTTNAAGPNGATAQCKDGTYSKSAHRAGTCAGHKGVQTWY